LSEEIVVPGTGAKPPNKIKWLDQSWTLPRPAFHCIFPICSPTTKIAGSTFTVSQQFEQLRTVLITTAGKFDDATGASGRTGAGLEALASFIERVGQAIEQNSGSINWLVDRLRDAASIEATIADTISRKAFSNIPLIFDAELQPKAAEQEAAAAAERMRQSIQDALDDAMLMLED
jgi:methyl-accepting chemotaxis protein